MNNYHRLASFWRKWECIKVFLHKRMHENMFSVEVYELIQRLIASIPKVVLLLNQY